MTVIGTVTKTRQVLHTDPTGVMNRSSSKRNYEYLNAIPIWILTCDAALIIIIHRGELVPIWVWFLPKFFFSSLFCHWWCLGSLPLSPLACLVGTLHFQQYYWSDCIDTVECEVTNLSWTMTSVFVVHLYRLNKLI